METVLEFCPERIRSIRVLEGLLDYDKKLELLKISPKRLLRRDLDELADGVHHQGVLFELTAAPELTVQKILKIEPDLLLVLDEVVDPQNLGSLLRVSEAAGVGGVIATERRTAPLSPSARKASAGASELLGIARVTNLQRTLDELKELGYWTVGTTLGESSKNLFEFEFPKRCALVLGSEGEGMRALTEKQCDFLVKLPMFGRLDSLNVAQAAAVFLFEYRRQQNGQ